MGNENSKDPQLQDMKPKACCNNFSLYISNGKIDSSDVTCSVCFLIFTSPRAIKCKHVFCQDCLQEWAKGNTVTCPLCRMESKRTKGSFGRADKRMQNKVNKLFLKCRNCCWTGSICQFFTQFSFQPYLDEQTVPGENIRKEEDAQRAEILEQKVQARQEQQKTNKAQKEKGEVFVIKDEQDSVVQLKKSKKNKDYEVFLDQIFTTSRIQPLPDLFPLHMFAQNDRLHLQDRQVNDIIGLQDSE